MPPAKQVAWLVCVDAFLAFPDLDQSVRDDVEKIESSPLLPDGIPVSGYVYEVGTGRLREVVPAS